MSITTTAIRLLLVPIRCSDSTPRRGFGAKRTPTRKTTTKRSGPQPTKAPGLNSQFDGEFKSNSLDLQFEERLKSVRRSALEQKKTDAEKEFGAIDYDAPVESEKKTIGLGTQIGVGVAVMVFGLVFFLRDFLPHEVLIPPRKARLSVINCLKKRKLPLRIVKIDMFADLWQARLRDFKAVLSRSPKDPVALEEKQSDPDVFRLLGEVKYELKDYGGSAAAYRTSQMVSKVVSFEVLRGLTNALLAAQKPDEVELLLRKAYSDWGHISDAVSVYDLLISSHPNDFRGYLAKGIVLKQNGKVGDAERMFIQYHNRVRAQFFAPEKAKALVDRYSR